MIKHPQSKGSPPVEPIGPTDKLWVDQAASQNAAEAPAPADAASTHDLESAKPSESFIAAGVKGGGVMGGIYRGLSYTAGSVHTAGRMMWYGAMQPYLMLYHRIEVDGRDHLPDHGPFVMISNHCSHLDAVVLSCSLPWKLAGPLRPVAAGDAFFCQPFVRFFTRWVMNAVPMWRHKCGLHALRKLRASLVGDTGEQPDSYIIFPEGTRSRDGLMNSFKAGLGLLVAGTDVPVIPCYIDGTYDAMPPYSRMPRPRKITLTIGKPLTFADVPNTRSGWRQVSHDTERAVKELVVPTGAASPRSVV